jgi:NodT family efflux transporter outer membrane factor (OMF) lipoprotein
VKLRSLLALVTLAGCSLAPRYERPKVANPRIYKEDGTWKRAQPSDHLLRGNWWSIFGDPELDALVTTANGGNQSIAAARANFKVARALLKQARAGYFPTVGVAPSVTRSRQPSFDASGSRTSVTSNSIALPLDAAWEPDLWGSVGSSVDSAERTAEASFADLENLRLSVRAEVAFDYFQIRALDALKEILDSTVVAYRESLDLAQARFDTGLSSDQDVAQAEAQLRSTEAQASDIGIQRARIEHALAVLMGKAPSEFTLPARPLTARPVAVPLGVPSTLLERRPDVAAAERRVAAANAQIGVARAAYFPTLTLRGSAGYQSSSFANLFDWPSFFWSLGASLGQTIFDGGRREGVTDQAWASYEGAVSNYRQTVLVAFQEVEDNLVALRLLEEELEHQTAAVEAANRYLTLATDRYELGIDSYLNVVIAQTTLLGNQRSLVNVRLQQMIGSVGLIKALGGGWNVSALDRATSDAGK